MLPNWRPIHHAAFIPKMSVKMPQYCLVFDWRIVVGTTGSTHWATQKGPPATSILVVRFLANCSHLRHMCSILYDTPPDLVRLFQLRGFSWMLTSADRSLTLEAESWLSRRAFPAHCAHRRSATVFLLDSSPYK